MSSPIPEQIGQREIFNLLTEMNRRIKVLESNTVQSQSFGSTTISSQTVSSGHESNTGNPHSTSVSNLTDTTITAAAARELLQFTGSVWEDKSPRAAIPEIDGFNGTTLEAFDCVITSDGATITATLEKTGTGDLTLVFSDGHTTLDCTPAQSIALTAGTEPSPQQNFLYILQSDKTQITKSTSDWPSGVEHIKIAYFLVQTAALVQSGDTNTNAALVNQNWNDHSESTDSQGHISHMAERIRQGGSEYKSGILGNGTSNYLTAGAGTTDFKSTAGVVYQLHKQTIPAFDTSAANPTRIHVINDSIAPYKAITDLYDITLDAAGNTITNNKYFNLVFFGAVSKGNEHQALFVNLPNTSGSGAFYNTQSAAEQDTSGYDVFTIPAVFDTVSYLICRITIQMKTGGGTWVVASTVSLLGLNVGSATGGAASNQTEFSTGNFKLLDSSDSTKRIDFDASAITTGTDRTVTMPDADVTLHNATVAGDLNHNDLSNIDAGDINHLTDAQVTALHAAVTRDSLGIDTDDSPSFAGLDTTVLLPDFTSGTDGDNTFFKTTNGSSFINVGIYLVSDASGLTAGNGLRLGWNSANAFLWHYENLKTSFATNNASRMTIEADGGVVVGSPTGASNGAGTINAQAVYDDNVLLTDYIFDLKEDGVMSQDDIDKHGLKDLLSIEQTEAFTKLNRHLPSMPGRDTFGVEEITYDYTYERSIPTLEFDPETLEIFEVYKDFKTVTEQKTRKLGTTGDIITNLWETVERQALHIFELNDRLKILEGK